MTVFWVFHIAYSLNTNERYLFVIINVDITFLYKWSVGFSYTIEDTNATELGWLTINTDKIAWTVILTISGHESDSFTLQASMWNLGRTQNDPRGNYTWFTSVKLHLSFVDIIWIPRNEINLMWSGVFFLRWNKIWMWSDQEAGYYTSHLVPLQNSCCKSGNWFSYKNKNTRIIQVIPKWESQLRKKNNLELWSF